MHRTNEDSPQHYPEHCRYPTPDDRDCWAEHRRKSGDRSIVVAEQDKAVGRHVVDIVPKRVSWCLAIRRKFENMVGEKFGVHFVSDGVRGKAEQHGDQWRHRSIRIVLSLGSPPVIWKLLIISPTP